MDDSLQPHTYSAVNDDGRKVAVTFKPDGTIRLKVWHPVDSDGTKGKWLVAALYLTNKETALIDLEPRYGR